MFYIFILIGLPLFAVHFHIIGWKDLYFFSPYFRFASGFSFSGIFHIELIPNMAIQTLLRQNHATKKIFSNK